MRKSIEQLETELWARLTSENKEKLLAWIISQ